VIQETDHAHTGVMTAAMLFAARDIDNPGMN
jgi:hypothetical protein